MLHPEPNKHGNYPCKCCGYYTLSEAPGGSTFEICPVCFWEDDRIQAENPNYSGGANPMSLNEARHNYKQLGACGEDKLEFVRKPSQEELPDE